MASNRETAAEGGRSRKGAIRDAASEALLVALGPLSVFALEAGLSVEEVYQLLRLAAVNQQVCSAAGQSASPTISGIAAVTGIPRAEVSKLLKQAIPLAKASRVNEQTTNAILVAWRQDPRFTKEDGYPARLAMYGRGQTFERLAEIHGRGIPTRALLDELTRTKSVLISPDQYVQQRSGVAIDRGITTAGIRAIGERVSELVGTMLHNMKNTDNTRIVTRVSSKRVPLARMPLLRREVTKITEQYLGEVRDLLERGSAHCQTNDDDIAVSVTTFCFEAPNAKKKFRRNSGEIKRKNYRRST